MKKNFNEGMGVMSEKNEEGDCSFKTLSVDNDRYNISYQFKSHLKKRLPGGVELTRVLSISFIFGLPWYLIFAFSPLYR
jgi:hypothetical protein